MKQTTAIVKSDHGNHGGHHHKDNDQNQSRLEKEQGPEAYALPHPHAVMVQFVAAQITVTAVIETRTDAIEAAQI